MNTKKILLLHPPGWSLNYGGPHLGIPIIQGYLKANNIPCIAKDMNIETAISYNFHIDQSYIKKPFDSVDADKKYFNLVREMKKVADLYDGDWKIKSGFSFSGCNLSSPEHIRSFSKNRSPFTDYYENEILPLIQEEKPLIVGFSITVPSQLLSTFELIRILRKSNYTGIIVIGGNTVSRLKEEMQLDWIFDLIDYVIVNQGEESLRLMYESLIRYEPIDTIPNIIYRNAQGDYIYTSYKKIDRKDLTCPDFTGYPVGEYWGINYLPIISARGCYYGKCEFCPIPFAWGNGGFVGYDDPKKILNFFIESIDRYNIHNFSFVDEAMSIGKLRQLANLIIENNLKIQFDGYAMFEKSWNSKENLALFQKAGLKKLHIGLETIGHAGRKTMKKSNNNIDILDYLKLFKKYGIKVHLFIMVGFPGTSIEDALETIEFVLGHRDLVETIDVSNFVYAKHTTVSAVSPSIEQENDFSLDYSYEVKNENDLTFSDALVLARSLESVVIQKEPQWTNPIYRMRSTWVD